jgi:hypothetical protein
MIKRQKRQRQKPFFPDENAPLSTELTTVPIHKKSIFAILTLRLLNKKKCGKCGKRKSIISKRQKYLVRYGSWQTNPTVLVRPAKIKKAFSYAIKSAYQNLASVASCKLVIRQIIFIN